MTRRIAAAEPRMTLPRTTISVVHRSDGSGTTSIFTTYLTSVSPGLGHHSGRRRPDQVGRQNGRLARRTSAPAATKASLRESTRPYGGVGYIDIAYALENNIPFADVQNKSGNCITPSLASLAAAADLPSYPADLRFNLANTAAAQGYPIAGTTWIIVYKDLSKVLKSEDRANALVDFFWWAIHEGQADAAPLVYGSIPRILLAQDEAAVKSITWAGTPLLP